RKQLAAAFPKVPEHRHDLAGSYNNLGLVLRALGRAQDAEAAFQESEKLLEALTRQYPKQRAYNQEPARRHNNRGLVLAALGRGVDAAEHFGRAQKLFEQLTAQFANVPEFRQELAVSHKNLGDLLRDTRPRDAEASYRQALKLRQTLADDF